LREYESPSPKAHGKAKRDGGIPEDLEPVERIMTPVLIALATMAAIFVLAFVFLAYDDSEM
jgi:hypothetical protein